ncbi:MAG TPA: aromatic ring-hydroxylating dioxygenase subunit alpha [Anaerolineales bacterium]
MTTFHKTDETYVSGSTTLPQKYYTGDDMFALEQERIFRKYWTCAGHQSRIPEAGNYFLLNLFGESLIVLRDKQGQIRAFYNVCRHRGTRICEEAEGRFGSSIQCSYHAWTYGLDGQLIGAPFMKEVKEFRWEDYPLRAAPVHLWEGFIFVHLSLDEPPPFEQTYAPLVGRFKQWNLAELRSERRIPYEVKSNWKYIFQNFNECYHCPTIHPLLNQFTDYTSGNNDLTDGPFLGGFMEITRESMTVTGRICALPLGELGEDGKRGYYYSILPNLLLNIHPDYVMFHLVFPEAPGRSLIVSDWLFNPASFDRLDFHPQEAVDFWHETNLQDWHVCELGQLGVSSQAYAPGWYTPRESLLAAFDRHYMKIMEVGS